MNGLKLIRLEPTPLRRLVLDDDHSTQSYPPHVPAIIQIIQIPGCFVLCFADYE